MLSSLNISQIEEKIGYSFIDKALLSRAFIHSSYANFKKLSSYERFEFLGDSLLGFVVADKLFSTFLDKQEGELTQMRQRIVEGKNLAMISQKLGFEQFVSVVKNVVVSDDILEDVLESLIAAIYLDGGFEKAKNFILKIFEEQFNNVGEGVKKDYKSIVNEKFAKSHIEYKSCNEGDEFEVQLFIDGQKMATAKARNKESAEKLCAEQLINTI